jgi:hypothetical protein
VAADTSGVALGLRGRVSFYIGVVEVRTIVALRSDCTAGSRGEHIKSLDKVGCLIPLLPFLYNNYFKTK